ncbi:MAG: TraR/DksA C4-type zinc finger protein [Acidobacteriota bacterium]
MQHFQAVRQQLTARHAEIQRRLQAITRDLRHESQPLTADFAEQATEVENDQVLDALDSSIRLELGQIERTLARMNEGGYGVCETCGKPIAAERMKALPHATRCIVCEEKRTVAS